MAIYFFQAGESGPIKIGHTRNVEERRRCTQCFHYETVRLLATGRGCMRIERELQAHFGSAHIRGEWFWPTREVLAAAAAVAAGANPYDLVPATTGKFACQSSGCCRLGIAG